MADIRVPPPPLSTQDQGIWSTWYVRVKDAINQLRDNITWVNLDFTSSNLTDIVTRNHNDLNNIQGGATAQRYHLTLVQHTDLTDGGVTTLHTHSLHNVATLDFGSISSNSTAELTATVTGATEGAAVYLGPPATIESGLVWCGYVSAADTVTVRLHNSTGGAINPANADWHIKVEAH